MLIAAIDHHMEGMAKLGLKSAGYASYFALREQ
jgi:hypothetical protein